MSPCAVGSPRDAAGTTPQGPGGDRTSPPFCFEQQHSSSCQRMVTFRNQQTKRHLKNEHCLPPALVVSGTTPQAKDSSRTGGGGPVSLLPASLRRARHGISAVYVATHPNIQLCSTPACRTLATLANSTILISTHVDRCNGFFQIHILFTNSQSSE